MYSHSNNHQNSSSESQASAAQFRDWLNSVARYHVDPNQRDYCLHRVLSTPTLYGPRTRYLENPCRCNNIVCTLSRWMDDRGMNQSATRVRFTRIDVILGFWSVRVEGRTDPRTGERRPVTIHDLITAVHVELHKPMSVFELEACLLPIEACEHRRILRQTRQHWRQRTGLRSDDDDQLYERVDFLQRHNADIASQAMYLKQLHSDPTVCTVGLI
ncbi:uncharacterized protein FOMMEDRAFT_154258 [Fomitiporia mediterranea MF3/22]|uniref:uncharacterized protein n=1 Tax=Fomitiporia mediterranea (strain MF3/22) TaxID=694068 RepID=UPI00044073CE|nr:uncharacterized protein FOMMEDRAFT_154258 [Fomitiporia mediterranea MF3/22]EJD05082.1 hypothetical protein FOMMEDRAFT_154258 [Fomitiporia mediterranea MF3/22]